MKKLLLSAILISSAATILAMSPVSSEVMSDMDFANVTPILVSYGDHGMVEKVLDENSTVMIDYSNLTEGEIILTYVDELGNESNTSVFSLSNIGVDFPEFDYELDDF